LLLRRKRGIAQQRDPIEDENNPAVLIFIRCAAALTSAFGFAMKDES
jgi:hypothetical protein